MINYILSLFYPKLRIQFSDIFYIGKKKIPIAVKPDRNGYVIKLGSGFASYTLQTTKEELSDLSAFINRMIK